ncbi:hypothetical protein POM88_051776 [Heracleum sosnowskyi]|uniref:Uncharacterized protein n=1 Tax=Heracleum sosnowskyi TaxID=360622 RepID=A0AAD8H073_9APIA|nr:hypothetical protein POM88_051776 [Heracleum sosnowskyi]
MEPSTWVTYAATWLSILALFLLAKYLRSNSTRKNLNLAPGPKPWPIIGNLNLIGALPHVSIHELSQKYGPLMQLKFGSFPVVVASSSEMAKIFLKTMDVKFVGRPKTAAGKYTTYNYSDITWSPYGSYWRQARKMCLMELFSVKRLESYEYIRVEEMKTMINNIYNLSGEGLALKDYLSTVSLNVISRMVVGKRYSDDTDNGVVKPEEFKKMLDELFLLNGVFNIGDSIPWIDFLDLQGYVKRMKRIADDPTLEVKLERHGVKAFTQDLLAGGTESSAVTVEWAISQLLKKPELFEKATEELDRVRFGSFPVVIASSVEMAKTFLTNMDANFSGRPRTASGKHTTYNYSDITWAPYGAYWRQARKWCVTELFSRKRIQSYEYIRREETKALLKELHEASGTNVVIKDYLAKVSLNVISRMVLGKKYSDDNDQEEKSGIISSKEFTSMIEELFYLNGVLNIGDSIPWIDFLDLQGYVKRMKSLSIKFDRFLEHVLDEHNERRKNEKHNFVATDMVDVLLQLADDPNLEVKIQRHGVKAFTQDLLAGGTESSAVTVEWAISELLCKPEIFDKATAELDRVIGKNRWIPLVTVPESRLHPELY